jgi:hypothetical protein
MPRLDFDLISSIHAFFMILMIQLSMRVPGRHWASA